MVECVCFNDVTKRSRETAVGIKQVITDDLTDETIDSATQPLTVRVEGEDYNLYLSDESKETFMALLRGEAPLLKRERREAATSNKGSGGSGKRSKTETYGYEYADVKAWAIANGVKAGNGNPITENTPRIGQHVYDEYRKAQGN